MSATELDTTEIFPKKLNLSEGDVEEVYRQARGEENGNIDYERLGNELIDEIFPETEHEVEMFDRFNSSFYSLGKVAAYLSVEFNDRGLLDSENQWYGRVASTERDSTSDNFEPAENLLEKPYIDQFDSEELNNLHMSYMEGKLEVLESQYDLQELKNE